jgi:hypothetical protein
MVATQMPNGHWRIILGHRPRRYLFFATRQEAEKAIRDEQKCARDRDQIRGSNGIKRVDQCEERNHGNR